jgi:hypothetical protein
VTLTDLLGIKLNLIKFEDERGLRLAEQLWDLHGKPSSGRALVDALENILQRCTEAGVPYPPILLKRKKEIERGVWTPKAETKTVAGNATTNEGDATCAKCGGSGYVPIEGGLHAKFCDCNSLMKRQKMQ